MRIMHLVNHCGKANGHVNVSVDLACVQSKNGHAVGYACSAGDFIPLLQQYGVEVFEVAEPHRGVRNFLLAQYSLWKAIRRFKPQVVHVHMAALSALMQPYRLFGYKIVTTVHNEFARSVRLMGFATRIVVVSQKGREAMITRGFRASKIRIVLNGTIGSPRLPAEFVAADIEHPAIITVCGLHPRKGVDDLLRAFKLVTAKFGDARLYIIGEGPFQAEYEALARALDIDKKTCFLGYQDDPRRYLEPADIFVLAAHADPGPLVIAEARNAGCAIVATDVGGIPEMLDQGAAGITVPPHRPDLLAREIEGLLSDPLKLQKYASLAKRNVSRFSVERVCRDMDEVYRDVI
jgi:glycosyltransferase involved in cell wall biosynthesis